MELKDWSPSGKESFTTPGGPFRLTDKGEAKTYAFDLAAAPRRGEPVRPAPRTPSAAAVRDPSPFARGAESVRPWYAEVSAEPRAAYAAASGQPQAPAVILSHDGETQTAVPVQTAPGGPQVYTIKIPTPRQPAPKQRSLWWVPLLVIAALLAGLALGVMAAPLLTGAAEPTATQADPGIESGAAARIYRENVDTVVSVIVTPDYDPLSSTYLPSSAGSGFVISEDGFILTNAHVVENAGSRGEIQVRMSDGTEYRAELLTTESAVSDLALLKIEAEGLHAAVLGSVDSARVGDWVCTIGNPLGELDFSLTTGYISAAPRQVNTGRATLTMLQLNTAVNKGNSGGPLFDAGGRVIGMVTAKLSGADTDGTVEGLGFALPINDVMDIVQPWLEAAKLAQ